MGSSSGREHLRPVLFAVVAIQLALGLVAAVNVSPPSAGAVAALGPVERPPVTMPPAPPSPPGETDAADATGGTVPLFEAAGAAKPLKTLTNPTFENVPLILHVLEDQGAWLRVRVNSRPNGATAWVRRSDVALRRVPNRIVVELGARRLTVLHGNDVLAQHKVAIGAPKAPTPIGEFYVDATVHILERDNSQYGVGQLSVSGFSEVYQTFGGGIGQIAIHGTNNPRSIGGTVSAGCIRLLNEDWVNVSTMAPNGTPVSIRA